MSKLPHPKIISCINSCKTLLQLKSCESFYNNCQDEEVKDKIMFLLKNKESLMIHGHPLKEHQISQTKKS